MQDRIHSQRQHIAFDRNDADVRSTSQRLVRNEFHAFVVHRPERRNGRRPTHVPGNDPGRHVGTSQHQHFRIRRHVRQRRRAVAGGMRHEYQGVQQRQRGPPGQSASDQ